MTRTLLGLMVIAGIIPPSGVAEGGSIQLGHSYSARALERLEARDLKLYLEAVADRSANPSAFDLRHPVLGQALSRRGSFEYWYNRWQAAPARFEHWHPRFWHYLHGGALAMPPFSPLTPLKPPASQSPEPPSSLPGPTDAGGPPPHIVTPEPSSLLLLAVSLGILLLVQGGRRCLQG